MQKMSKYIRKANFMFSSESIVASYDKDDLQQMVHLESRRASKWKHYSISAKLMTLFIFIYYFGFIFSFFSFIFGNITSYVFVNLLFIKIIPEFLAQINEKFKIK